MVTVMIPNFKDLFSPMNKAPVLGSCSMSSWGCDLDLRWCRMVRSRTLDKPLTSQLQKHTNARPAHLWDYMNCGFVLLHSLDSRRGCMLLTACCPFCAPLATPLQEPKPFCTLTAALFHKNFFGFLPLPGHALGFLGKPGDDHMYQIYMGASDLGPGIPSFQAIFG